MAPLARCYVALLLASLSAVAFAASRNQHHQHLRQGANAGQSRTARQAPGASGALRTRSDGGKSLRLPEPTAYGYLSVNPDKDSAMFYMYYEAMAPEEDPSTTPIVLWLQGGPGCSSFFGMLYINGPYFVNPDLTLRPNPGSWSRLYGMLFIEQPIGVGWSRAGSAHIPDNELDVAWDLYRALQSFYRQFPAYQKRPLIVTGESYAGKYVPSIGHFILQADAQANGYADRIKHPRALNNAVEPPLFSLGGIAIGNGFTDAETQTAVQAEVAWNMGLISMPQRKQAERIQEQVIDLVRSKQWRAARQKSDELLHFITNASGSATLEDIRRNTGYDGSNLTDSFLNQPHVKQALGVPLNVTWESCSAEVDKIMGHDVMKSVKNLVLDLLSFKPVLLYQGQFDAECGVASNDAWISTMAWHGHHDFALAPRNHWLVNGRIAFYWRAHERLSHVIIRNTGHMVPHDNPLYGQLMLERWVEEAVRDRRYDRQVTPEMERDYANPDQGDQST